MLTLAATHGRAHVVNILCQIKCDPSIENTKVSLKNQNTPNQNYCTFDLQNSDPQGWSAIHVAAVYGHTNVLQAFLSLGIRLDLQDSHMVSCQTWLGTGSFTKLRPVLSVQGFTPAHLVAASDQVKVLQFLQENRVEITKLARNVSSLSIPTTSIQSALKPP